MKFQNVKGSNDFYPEDKAIQKEIFDSLRSTVKNYSFLEVETPVFESLNLLTAKSGEEVKSQIFTLEKKGNEDLGLRFDLTVPLTRLFVTKQKTLQKPVKWFALDKNWRYEAPQKGREREFYQLSVELFGSKETVADAEIIQLAVDCLKNLGLKESDFKIKINNRKLLEGILLKFIPKESISNVTRIIDKSRKITKDEFEESLAKEGVSKTEELIDLISFEGQPSEIIKKISILTLNDEANQGFKEIQNLFSLIDSKSLILDLSIARGLEYYSGTVFEIFDSKEEFRSIGGGGRYDNLIKLFGGTDCPATGFAIGFSTLSLLLKSKNLIPQINLSPDLCMIPTSEDLIPDAFKIAGELRKKYSVYIDLLSRKVPKQLEYSNSKDIKKVVFIGPDELNQKKIKLKNMVSGKEILVSIPEMMEGDLDVLV